MKVKGPLFSMKAKGSFGCITFKDINLEGNKHMTVAHLKQKRKKPITCEKNKEAFKKAVSLWKELTPEEKQLWENYDIEPETPLSPWQAELSGYHKMISLNVKSILQEKEVSQIPY